MSHLYKSYKNKKIFKNSPKSEYDARWAKAKKLMEKENIDALFITGEHNFVYFSGNTNWTNYPPGESWARPGIMILPREGEPSAIIGGADADRAKLTGWVENIKKYVSLPFSVDHPSGGRYMVKEAFEELKLTKGTIGCEFGEENRLGIPYSDFIWLQKEMPKAKFVDATKAVINKMRAVKSPLELERHRKICAITSKALEQTLVTMKGANMTGREITMTFFKFLLDGGADRPGFCIHSGSPMNRGNPYWRPKRGETFWLDCAGVWKGYWSDFTRQTVVGKPTRKLVEWHNWHWEVTQKCMDAMMPGVPIADIARLCDEEYRKKGLPGFASCMSGRIGHSVGLSNGEPPSISLNDSTILEEGMVIAIEPIGVRRPSINGMIHVEENVIIKTNGYELLSTTPRDLFVI